MKLEAISKKQHDEEQRSTHLILHIIIRHVHYLV